MNETTHQASTRPADGRQELEGPPALALSIVIASGAEGEFLSRCLDSLRAQVASPDVEVIVADRCGGEKASRIRGEYPFVHLIRAASTHRPSVPELRALGVGEAKGRIVAIIEEHCVALPDWVETIRSSFEAGDAALGGPILDDNYRRLRDWVVYFSEYHNYMPPWPPGERYLLNGANIAYPQEMLARHTEKLTEGYWEVVLHPVISQEGRFRSVPAMGVRHTGPFDYRYYLRQRYLLSRVWGGTQRQKVSPGRRLLYLVVAPILPLLLLIRIARRAVEKRRYLRKFLQTVPLMIPVSVAYVWGEWLGYLAGMGDALEWVE
jgi:glycosyltransferase involved in cell wall biosynthesis